MVNNVVKTTKALPEVLQKLVHMGEYIRIARKRRRLTMAEVAERLGVGYQTIFRMEHGDPSVAVSVYMSALWLFGLDRAVVAAVHPDNDESGKALERARMPKRVGVKKLKGADYDF